MSNLLTELTTYISNAGFGTQGTDLFIGTLPDAPDDALMLFGAGGPGFDPYVSTGYASVDVWARCSVNSGDAYDKLTNLVNALHREQNFSLGRFYVYFISAQSNILDLDRDSMGRKLFKVTLRVIYLDTNVVS